MSDGPWDIGGRPTLLKERVRRLLGSVSSAIYEMKIPQAWAWPSCPNLTDPGTCPSAGAAELYRFIHRNQEDARKTAASVLTASESWEQETSEGTTEKLFGIRCRANGHMGPGTTAKICLKLLPFKFNNDQLDPIVESLLMLVEEDGSVRCEPPSMSSAERLIPAGLVLIFLCEYRLHQEYDPETATGKLKEMHSTIVRIGNHLSRLKDLSKNAGWKLSCNTEEDPDPCATAICLEAAMLSGSIAEKDAKIILHSMYDQLRRGKLGLSEENVGKHWTHFYYNTSYHVTRAFCTALSLGYCNKLMGHRALRLISRHLYTEYCTKPSDKKSIPDSSLSSNVIAKLTQDMSALAIISDVLWHRNSDDRYHAWRFSKWSQNRSFPKPIQSRSRLSTIWRWCWSNKLGFAGIAISLVGVVVGIATGSLLSYLSLFLSIPGLLSLFRKISNDGGGSAPEQNTQVNA